MTLKFRILKYWFLWAYVTSMISILFINKVSVDKPSEFLQSIAYFFVSILIFAVYWAAYNKAKSQNDRSRNN